MNSATIGYKIQASVLKTIGVQNASDRYAQKSVGKSPRFRLVPQVRDRVPIPLAALARILAACVFRGQAGAFAAVRAWALVALAVVLGILGGEQEGDE